ncbi:MAG: hypothetical protein ACOVQ8_14105 [Elstera sp.]
MVTVPQQPLPTGIITSAPTGPTPLFFEGTVGVADMPSWLKQIPNGAVLQATVQGRVAQNTYSLLTAQGPITISSSLALQAGTQLLFQIGPELQSQRLQLVGGTNPNPLPQPILPTTAAPLLPLPQAAAGQTLNAIVIRPADPAPLASGTPSAGSTGALTQSAPSPTTVPAQAGVAAYASHSVTATPSAPTALLGTPPAASAPAAPFPGVQAPGTSAPSAGSAPSLGTPAPTPATPATPGFPGASAVASSTAAGIAPPTGGRAAPASTAPLVASPSFPVTASPSADLSVFAVTQAGEQVTVRVVAVTPPQPDTATAVKSGHAAPPTTPAPASTPFAFLREGLAALLSASPTAPATAATGTPNGTVPQPAGPVLTGTVIGNGAQNRPIIAIGSAILSLEAGPLQPGSQVQLVAQLNAPAATPNTLATSAQAQPPLQSFPTYPSLPALIAAAQQIGGPTEQAIRAMLPQIGPQLAASLMVFASGAAKGDVRTLVGDSARASLERSARGRAALQGLTQEFEAAEDEARGTPAADWRAITLPVMTGGAMIEPIRLYLHQVSDEEAERNRNNEGGGQRFVLDLDLTQLGAIQIDGLAKHDKLDLVVRTPKPLPDEIRNGLRNAFLGGTTAYGVIGGLNFQVGPRLVLETGQPAVRRGGLYI